MMALKKPTDEITLVDLLGDFIEIDAVDNRSLSGLKNDSREIKPGDLFLACRGYSSNGAQFIDDAISAGACAVVVEADLVSKNAKYAVPVIRLMNLSARLGLIAHRFYQGPSDALNVIAVTGTNGKTSVAQFIAMTLSAVNGRDVGLIGTLGIGTAGKLRPGVNTTPDALTIHHTLAEMRDNGTENVVMEVSSHGLVEARVAGVSFDIGIFTNLSQDHLDYHGTMEAYAEAKRQLFLFESLRSAVINIDDEYGQHLKNELEGKLRVISYSTRQKTSTEEANDHVYGYVTDTALGALSLNITSPWGEGTLSSKLSGEFNAGNLLASLSALCLSGITFTQALEGLSNVDAVAGRMECFAKAGFARIIVDYAHTPDALEKALTSLQNITEGRLICVVGCGGDRDKSKRPLMGKIAENNSDQIILTSDNPRSEDPLAIIEHILAGFERRDAVNVIPDRSAAIAHAIKSAHVDDVILIAGKGHETWQEIAGVRTPFSDRQLVRNLLEKTE